MIYNSPSGDKRRAKCSLPGDYYVARGLDSRALGVGQEHIRLSFQSSSSIHFTGSTSSLAIMWTFSKIPVSYRIRCHGFRGLYIGYLLRELFQVFLVYGGQLDQELPEQIHVGLLPQDLGIALIERTFLLTGDYLPYLRFYAIDILNDIVHFPQRMFMFVIQVESLPAVTVDLKTLPRSLCFPKPAGSRMSRRPRSLDRLRTRLHALGHLTGHGEAAAGAQVA